MSRTDERKPTTFRRLVLRLSIRNTLIPVLVFVSVFLLAYNAYSQHLLIRRNEETCENSSMRLQAICRSYTGYLEDLAASESIEAILAENAGSAQIYSEFYRFLSGQEYRGTFYLLDKGKQVIASLNIGESGSSENSIRRLADRCDQNGYAVTSEKTIISISFTSSERSRAYTVAVPVVREEGPIGYLVYRFYEKGLIDFLNAGGVKAYVLTDRNGGIIASNTETAEDALDRFLPQFTGEHTCRIGEGSYYAARKNIEGTDLQLYTLSRQISFLDAQALLPAALILGAVVVSLLIHSRSLARRITEPVDQLLDTVQQLKTGEFTQAESLSNLEEFRQLFGEYNDSVRQLDKLMETQQSLKLHQLEAQFNPHFLYNVLETLKYTIATDTEAAQDIVLRLSHLMRYAATPAEHEVRLGDDLVYIENYLALQKQRFLDRLSYRLEASNEAKEARIFRLLLQPLIENAIKYGYVSRQKITVAACCRREGSDLVMSVADDGGGMTKERLAEVQRILDGGVNDSGCLGLYNTHQMIRLKYGAPYGLTLENREGEGLTAVVRMPYKR